mmetsp:Transcript_24127/g.61682  ORF Transcript_24127/g.61682 Transcript_24127/m.61682 type:complete len:218 (-) Transcript_24127:288-941(-)
MLCVEGIRALSIAAAAAHACLHFNGDAGKGAIRDRSGGIREYQPLGADRRAQPCHKRWRPCKVGARHFFVCLSQPIPVNVVRAIGLHERLATFFLQCALVKVDKIWLYVAVEVQAIEPVVNDPFAQKVGEQVRRLRAPDILGEARIRFDHDSWKTIGDVVHGQPWWKHFLQLGKERGGSAVISRGTVSADTITHDVAFAKRALRAVGQWDVAEVEVG